MSKQKEHNTVRVPFLPCEITLVLNGRNERHEFYGLRLACRTYSYLLLY